MTEKLAPRIIILVRAGHIRPGCARVLSVLAPRFQVRYIDSARELEPAALAAHLEWRAAVERGRAAELYAAAGSEA
jgi:hypothetical protein